MICTKKTYVLVVFVLLFLKISYPKKFINDLNSTNPVVENKHFKDKIDTTFYENRVFNRKKAEDFNKFFVNKKEEITIIDDIYFLTTTLNNTLNSSKNDSYQISNGKNHSTRYEFGEIRYKAFRFTNIYLPSNTVVTNAKLTITRYKYG